MFPIGTFSRLCQLSIRVLRHYDEIGLLVPAHTSRTNGYRYYATEQLADAHRIIALKQLGLSLEQVKAVLTNAHSVDAIAHMLQVEKQRAEQERAALEQRQRDLERRLLELTDLGRLSKLDVIEKSVEAMPLLAYRSIVADLDAAYGLMEEVVARCASLKPPGPFVAVAYADFFDDRNLDLELGYAVSGPEVLELPEGRRMTLRQLPGVERMLSVMYVGTQTDGHRASHQALASWLASRRCELAGPGRELIHAAKLGGSETIEIQYPVAALDV
ncbi:MAG TPA: helix-turn-helix domain-containing protein [Polyangiales bacterium]|nr:helix-turn-helix domain-containing protein [Polyangiales bacterium]